MAKSGEKFIPHGHLQVIGDRGKRSTLSDYRLVLDTYLLPAKKDTKDGERRFPRAPFGATALRDLRPAQIKGGYDLLPYGARPRSC